MHPVAIMIGFWLIPSRIVSTSFFAWVAGFSREKVHNLKANNILVICINMGVGHFANSERYGRLKDYAKDYTLTLLVHGIKE